MNFGVTELFYWRLQELSAYSWVWTRAPDRLMSLCLLLRWFFMVPVVPPLKLNSEPQRQHDACHEHPDRIDYRLSELRADCLPRCQHYKQAGHASWAMVHPLCGELSGAKRHTYRSSHPHQYTSTQPLSRPPSLPPGIYALYCKSKAFPWCWNSWYKPWVYLCAECD